MKSEFIIVSISLVYMILLLLIGYYSSLKTKSREDFFLASRSLGSWVTAISSTASSESGWVVLGFVGLAYKEGVVALWTAIGCLFGYFINLYLLAPRLREKAKSLNSLTLLDYISDSYDKNGNLLRITSSIIILLSLLGYVSAQMTAVGKAMNAFLPVDYKYGVIIGGIVIIVYTLIGGFRAVSYTDFVQGLIMVFALIVMPLIVLIECGGYFNVINTLNEKSPEMVFIFGNREGFTLLGFILGLLGIGLGYPGQPHVITRYMAAKSEEKIRQSQIIAMIWGTLVFYGAGILGISGRLLLPELNDPEQLFPILSKSLLNPIIAGIMLAAVLSAIMSTVSSQLLVISSTLSRDLLDRALMRLQSEKEALLIGRLSILIMGIFSIFIALTEIRIVFWFVLFAWSGLGASFGPLILSSLKYKNITKLGAFFSVVSGFLTTIIWKVSGLSDSIIYELIPAFLISGIFCFAISYIENKVRRKHENIG